MTKPLTVLMSFPPPRPTSNPYNTLLMDAVAAQPDTRVRTFSWKRFLLGGYDVFHVHWPEILVNGQSYPKKKVRQLLFTLGLLRLRATRTPLVRTLHNLELPQEISWSERTLLRWAERWTTHWIVINPSGEIPPGANVSIALHGHYRPWYAKYPQAERVHGRFGFFGMIRRYKNAVGLVKAFRELPGDDVSLRVCGRPSSDELAGEIRDAAADDPRVELVLDFLDDRDLVTHVTASQLIVLPYPEMHNSGAVFAALSLDRPVLVPDNEVNRQLADEVGADWVLMYDGDLTSEALAKGCAGQAGSSPMRVRTCRHATGTSSARTTWPHTVPHFGRSGQAAASTTAGPEPAAARLVCRVGQSTAPVKTAVAVCPPSETMTDTGSRWDSSTRNT